MSYANGWAALNMKFSEKVPRTEYSAHVYHWDLMETVTGIDTSDLARREDASREFVRRWDYSFMWNVGIGRGELEAGGGRVTSMGHAVFGETANGQGDFNNHIDAPFSDLEEVYKLDPCKEYQQFGHKTLIDLFEKQYADACRVWPDMVNMSGVYTTMFSGLIEIFGWDSLLMAMGYDEKRFGKVIEGYYEWCKQFFDAYAATSIPVMMVHDDLCWTSGPVTHPDWYRKNIFPYIKKLLEPVQASGKKIMFTSDGTIDELFDDIVVLGVDSVVMEPTSNMAVFAEKYGDRVGFVGGMDCRLLTYGSHAEIKKEMQRIMTWGQKYPGFMLASGNHLPANVPVDNALYYNDLYEELAVRK